MAFEGQMREAIAEGMLASASGDVPVGAILYGPDGAELARGRNERELLHDPTAHAEIVALRRAAAALGTWRLDGATLVVSLEPCVMCAGAIAAARVERLAFGAWDDKAGAVGSVHDVLRDRRALHRVEVFAGVLADEAAAPLEEFFSSRRG